MKQLVSMKDGLRIGDSTFNSFAYADDIALYSPTVPGLQSLINVCSEYAKTWRFRFGLSKSKCMITGYKPNNFINDPVWYMNGEPMNVVDNVDILGVNFSSNVRYDNHVKSRVQKCKRSMYSMSNIGMCYSGLNSSSKMHLFRSVCQPTLMYGVECLNISSKHVHILNSAQGSVVKHVPVLSVRARHTALLQALDISQAGDHIKKSTLSLYNRICSQDSPTRDLCMYFTQMYISSGIRVPGSLVDIAVIAFGASPLCINHNFIPPTNEPSGVG